MTNSIRIQLAQLNFTVGDLAGNSHKICQALAMAKQQPYDIIVLPELALCGYLPDDLLLRSDFISACQSHLQQIATTYPEPLVVMGAPQSADNQLFNTAALLQGGSVNYYHKQCLPNHTVFDEKRYFSAGQLPYLINIKGLQVGIIVCEDLWCEPPAQQAAAAGAQVLIVINASPYALDKHQQRLELLRQRAQSCKLPILYVNMVGGQDDVVFDGHSLVVNANGELIVQGPHCQEAFINLELSAAGAIVNSQIKLLPKAFDLPTASCKEGQAYQALVLGLHDYMAKNGFEQVWLGLSGGIDSALTLALAVDALGPDKVNAVLMPSRHTSELSLQLALAQAQQLQVAHQTIAIEPTYQALLASLADSFTGKALDTTEENLQARVRGTILMALSNKHGGLVLTTSNKSELAVGYGTLYGDMAGAYAPLKDVYKTLVYRLAHYRNQINPVIPEQAITRPPSAELSPGQTDQDSLPPYERLDKILFLYLEERASISELLAAGFSEAEVKRIVKLVARSEYKRHQAAPGPKISSCAFGRERRYPITANYQWQINQ